MCVEPLLFSRTQKEFQVSQVSQVCIPQCKEKTGQKPIEPLCKPDEGPFLPKVLLQTWRNQTCKPAKLIHKNGPHAAPQASVATLPLLQRKPANLRTACRATSREIGSLGRKTGRPCLMHLSLSRPSGPHLQAHLLSIQSPEHSALLQAC